ncbi:MAG: CoA ester lyase [Pseudomonadota bacterium]
MTYRPRRSVLYMPGANTRALEKAKTLSADCIILDLEDAVAPEMKHQAREHVKNAVEEKGYGAREVIVRINGLDTPWGRDDMAMVAQAQPNAVLVPKVNTKDDVLSAAQSLNISQASNVTKLWVMMETPLAILNAKEIALCAQDPESRLTCFVMGTNDLAKDTAAHLTDDRLPLISWLSTCVAAAKAYNISIIDGVYNDLNNEAAFHQQCRQGLQLGMDGKTLIHPKQLEVCNEVFAPDAEEVAWAQKILDAFAMPENQNKGALSLEGRMVERLHAEMAAKTIAIAKAIQENISS